MGLLGGTASLLEAVVGPGVMLLFPLYASMRAIESPSTLDDQQWLTYWILYSLTTLFELSCWKVLQWFPFWPYIKLVFCMWLVLPVFNGAAYIYENYVRQYVKLVSPVSQNYPENQKRVLQMMSLDARKSVEKYIEKYGPDAFDRVVKAAEKEEKDKDQKKTVQHSMLLCCKLFISESRNKEALDLIERAVKRDPETVIVNKFEDREYNRVNYTLVSYVAHNSIGYPIYSPLHQSVMAMVEAAYEAINLELHSGAHPRLGVVDDIVFHPLGRASLDEAAWLAKAVAADIGNRFQVPVYLYGAAHPTGKALDTIRRELGYFRPNYMGNQWAGWMQPEILPERPNEGPNTVTRARGITMIGARSWVATYNVPILSTDVSIARRIARMVSARGGGLPTVQTLGLAHGDTTEIACILLEPNQIGADQVQNLVQVLAKREGLDVEKGYFTDLSPEMIVESYMKLISSGSA